MKKSKTFLIATSWPLRKILNNHLCEAPELCGGYIDAKYRKVKVTVIVEPEEKYNKSLHLTPSRTGNDEEPNGRK